MGVIRWSPDTCGCIIHYNIPEKTLARIIKKCIIHENEPDETLFGVVLTHNRANNQQPI